MIMEENSDSINKYRDLEKLSYDYNSLTRLNLVTIQNNNRNVGNRVKTTKEEDWSILENSLLSNLILTSITLLLVLLLNNFKDTEFYNILFLGVLVIIGSMLIRLIFLLKKSSSEMELLTKYNDGQDVDIKKIIYGLDQFQKEFTIIINRERRFFSETMNNIRFQEKKAFNRNLDNILEDNKEKIIKLMSSYESNLTISETKHDTQLLHIKRNERIMTILRDFSVSCSSFGVHIEPNLLEKFFLHFIN